MIDKLYYTFSLILFSSFLLIQNTNAQVADCANFDFEFGDTSNWNAVGNVSIVQKTQIDPYGNFNLATSGDYAVQLGNKILPTESSVSRQYTVNATNNILIYSFAIVLLGYPHDPYEAAYVNLEITDSSGDTIPCGNYLAVAQSTAGNGFLLSNSPFESNLEPACCFPIFYKSWETRLIDLTPYIGQTINLKLSSDWCIYGVDWGYAYVDLYCTTNLFTESFNCDLNSNNIIAAPGLPSYAWTGPGIVAGQGTNQILINQAGTYTLDVLGPNSQCPSIQMSYVATMNVEPDIPIAAFNSSSVACETDTLNFQNLSSSLSNITENTWYFGDGTQSLSYNSSHFYPSIGDYQVSLAIENEFGCEDSISKTIKVVAPFTFDLGPDRLLCEPNGALDLSFDLGLEGATQVWSTGSKENQVQISDSGYVSLTVTYGCEASDSIYVKLVNVGILSSPNVFTPNGDQINDFLTFDNVGVTDYELIILDRWGEVMFQTNDPTKFWDGNFNNRNASDGVYFYKINYRTDCHEDLQTEHGHATLLRGY